MNGDHKKGYFFIFLTGVFFAFEVISFKYIFKTYHLNPEIAAFYGVSIAFLILCPYFLVSKSRRDKIRITINNDGKVLLIGTILNSIGILMYYFGLRISDLGPSALLIKMTVLYNVLFGVFLLDEKLRITEVIGILLAISGIIVISTLHGQIEVSSAIIMLVSALFFAIQSYLIKKYVIQIDGMTFAFLRLFLLSIFFLIYIILMGTWEILEAGLAISLGIFSLLGYFLGRAFYFEAHNHLPISKLNSVLLIEPVFLMFIGILFLGEPLSFQKSLGTILILSGLYLLIFHKRKKII